MTDHHEYTDSFVSGLQWMWGAGFLSPGGEAEVAEILRGVNIRGSSVLDIGCGLGGADLALVRSHGAAEVVGIDIDASLIDQARISASEADLSECIDFKQVTPGALPFGEDAFDVVFSKDSMIHIADKLQCYSEIARVLKTGGVLAIGDWFGSAEPISDEMEQWLQVVGLTFTLGTLTEAATLLNKAGFTEISTRDRNDWYATYIDEELATLQGDNMNRLAAMIGQDAARQRLQSSMLKKVVIQQGQLRPGHIQAINQN